MTSFTFGRFQWNTWDGGGNVGSPANATETVLDTDGDASIDVGEDVTMSTLPYDSSDDRNGLEDGGPLHDLGVTSIKNSGVGFVFDDARTFDASTKFAMLVEPDEIAGAVSSDCGIPIKGSDNPGTTSPTVGTTPACFLEGTLITTPQGDVPVQDLRPGHMILKPCGRETTVLFVGAQTLHTFFGVPERLRPVRFKAGCLGAGLPRRDLIVTGDHGFLIDNLLVNASALVNDTTITWDPLPETGTSFRVYHVETEAHELLLAEGVPAETFFNYIRRDQFDNFAEYQALYYEERFIKEMDVPRVYSSRLLAQRFSKMP